MQDKNAMEALSILLARQQIVDLTSAYCRGVDRADEALLQSLFHHDAMVFSGIFDGPGPQFATEICQIVKSLFVQTSHSIANQWIEISGDRAIGETYVTAAATLRSGEDIGDTILTGGRYLDRFQRTADVWKFAERRFVTDWSIVQPTLPATPGLHGTQGQDDPVYALWGWKA